MGQVYVSLCKTVYVKYKQKKIMKSNQLFPYMVLNIHRVLDKIQLTLVSVCPG